MYQTIGKYVGIIKGSFTWSCGRISENKIKQPATISHCSEIHKPFE